MASDSQTATATTSGKPLEKEIVLETVDMVKDKPVSHSDLTVDKEEQIDQTRAGELEKEIPADVEVKADESTLKEPNLVKEVNVQEVDGEKAEEGKGKDVNGEEKVAEHVELKEPTVVKESVNAEKAEEKLALESVAEGSIVETKDSGSALCPKENVPINQDSDTAHTKETEGDASSPPDVIEKHITEEKQVMEEEPSKDEKEKVSEEEAKKDTETPVADVQSEETLKETEVNKQEESVAEVVETETVAKEIDEPKQEPEVMTKEVKQSRSIMSKVKQSLVKAKKAIIGKSPSSKTITTEETKEEIIIAK